MKPKKHSIDHYISLIEQEDDAFQKARLINYLYHEEQLRYNQIAAKLNLHPSHISHYVRLLDLPQIVIDGYYAQHISESHLFILSRLDNQKDIVTAYRKILAEDLTIAQTEELIREIKHNITKAKEQLNPNLIKDFKTTLEREFNNVQVKVVQTRIKGKIVIETKGDTKETKKTLTKLMVKLLAQEAKKV